MLEVGKVGSHLELLNLLHRSKWGSPGSNSAIFDTDISKIAFEVIFFLVYYVICFFVIIVFIRIFFFFAAIEFFIYFIIFTVFLFLLLFSLCFASLLLLRRCDIELLEQIACSSLIAISSNIDAHT